MKKLCVVFCTALIACSVAFAQNQALIDAAKKEGKVVVYSITSRISSAAKAFEAKYGIKVESANLNDAELIKKVSTEVGGNIIGADFVIAQNSGRVQMELIDTGYLVNYIPDSMKNVIAKADQNPLVFQYINKVFIFNSEKSNAPPFTNIWELTEPKFRNRIQFKDPLTETVNMNFLTMLTSKEWADKIAAAYKDLYKKDIVLSKDCPNAGYEWIKRFFANVVFGNSDTTISENVGKKGNANQLMGLFVYSKSRYEESKNLALTPATGTTPFAGFLYPAFMLMTKNASHPNAAKLFIEYLLTVEGFKPWSADVGSYSSNPAVPINEGDHPLTYWRPLLVTEDPKFLAQNLAKVSEFVNNAMQR